MWQDPTTGVEMVEGSPQIVELAAVVRAFSKFPDPINIGTDSAYVAGILERAENSLLKDIANEHLYSFLKNLIFLLSQRQHPSLIMHIPSHATLPGPLTQGNNRADTLATVSQLTLPNILERAKLSHAFVHPNAPA